MTNIESNETTATETNTSTGEIAQTESTMEASSSETPSETTAEGSGENGGEEEGAGEEPTIMTGMVKATFLPQNKMLVVDLSTLTMGGDRPGVVDEAVARAYPTPATVDQPRTKRQPRQPKQIVASGKRMVPKGHNGNGEKVEIEPGKKIKIHAPEAGMVVRADQTLMLKLNKDGSADILQTENWGYPPESVTGESITLKAKPTANFLNFQDPEDGYRFAWLANLEKQEVIQVAKRGKFLPKEIQSYMEKGYTEFMYAPGHASKHFRLPTGTIVTSKRVVDLSPEETKKEAKKVKNLPTVATLTGALSGTIKG